MRDNKVLRAVSSTKEVFNKCCSFDAMIADFYFPRERKLQKSRDFYLGC